MVSIFFDKLVEQLRLSDIYNLKTRKVAEGLYAEYKRDFSSAKKISHSIASFANTYGGWYIVGIETDEDNVPEAFPGFDLFKIREPKEKIRNVVVDHINPVPTFYSRLLKLDDNKGILIVHIPESYEKPHITKDGRIYRRNAEGSDPVPENDRYTIDKMYEEGRRFNDIVENFCQREFNISRAEENRGWLEIYFLTYPFNQLFIPEFFDIKYIRKTTNFFKEKITLFNAISMGITFDNVTTSLESIIFRQTTPKSLPYLTLTFQYFRNGNAKITIPFFYLDLPPQEWERLRGSTENIGRLLSMLEADDFNFYGIIDGWKLYSPYVVLIGKYVELLKQSGWQNFILARYRLVNTWRHVLFFDDKKYVDYLKEFGVPLCMRNESQIPNLLTKNFIKTEMPLKNTGLLGDFAYILECLSIQPVACSEIIASGWLSYLKKMIETP